jgi:hypothetical protein
MQNGRKREGPEVDPKKIGNESYTTDPARLQREIQAEKEQAAFVKESQAGLSPKCPDCGALGSLEPQPDGAIRCIDCDLVIGATSKLPGFGRR